MREAILYQKLPGARVRCAVCQWRCLIAPGKLGVCRVRQNRDGAVGLLNYGEVSSAAVDPIEKKPLFHFFPGSQVFSLGGWGCNFHCKHCQNWEISCVEPSAALPSSRNIAPEASLELTRRHGCAGVAWTYNEPTMWLEYTLDSAKLARKAGLYTVYVTNGYITPEALDVIGPYLDAWRVDVKGFSDALYRRLARVTRWRAILEMAKRAQEKWGMHVEVVTNLIPSLNDDQAQLEAMATWIREELGELTPWHVTRFYPQHLMRNLPPTPVSSLERALEVAQKAGLRFTYIGNVPGHAGENTVCYSCGKVVVERVGYHTRVVGLDGSKCRFCAAELNMKTVLWK